MTSFKENEKFNTFIDILSYRAEHRPDEEAYKYLNSKGNEKESLTYSELDRRARALAAEIQSMGVSEGERALLLYPPSLEYITAFFACLYAGVVAVPAYPPHPARLDRTLPKLIGIIEDADPKIGLTTTDILNGIQFLANQYPVLNKMKWIAADSDDSDSSASWRYPAVTPNSIAFLQYTSGSTGRPKGVMVAHGNLIHNQTMIAHAFKTHDKSVVVGWLPLYHDMGLIGNVLHPMYMGIPCILMSPIAFLKSPYQWLKAISDYRGTISGGPNFAYDLCVRKINPDMRASLDLSCWERAFNGSEPIRKETLDRFSDYFRSCGFRRESFLPCYGMAESTLIISGGGESEEPLIVSADSDKIGQNKVVFVHKDSENRRDFVGSGQILPEENVAVVDPNTFMRCADNEIGEIWVSGPGVTRGYWRKTKLTADIFEAVIAGDGEGDELRKWLRTGDLGFIYQNELFITGRLKDMILIRGGNHYPQDIELTVERSYSRLRPGCSAAFSVDVDGEERLVIVAEAERRYNRIRRQDGKKEIEEDRRWQKRRQYKVLPEYPPEDSDSLNIDEAVMLIREAVSRHHDLNVYAVLLLKVGSIPKTTSGKIQRHACRSGFLDGSLEVLAKSVGTPVKQNTGPVSLERLKTAGADEHLKILESWFREVISGLLKIDPSEVTPDRSLNQLGLDSLAAVELQHQIEIDLEIAWPLTKLLRGPSIRELISDAVKIPAANEAGGRIPVHPGIRTGEFPLSHNQQSLWFMYRLAPESAAYNVCFPVRIKSEVDIPALKRAWGTIIERHASLRTTYSEHDGEPVQIVHAHGEPDFVETDVSSRPETEVKAELESEARRPFDLENGPVIRMRLYKKTRTDFVFLLVFHHIAVDLWSLSVLMDEFRRLYPAELANKSGVPVDPAVLDMAPVPYIYPDYVGWQTGMLAGKDGENLKHYWKRRLNNDPPVLDLPFDHPRPPVQTFNGSSCAFELSEDLTGRITNLANTNRATLYMTLAAAFTVLMHRYTHQTDVWIGSPAAGRSRPEFKDMVGYLANPVVIRSNLSQNPEFGDFLNSVKETVLEALTGQDYPFSRLVETLQPERNAAVPPLFQAMFVLEKPHRVTAAAPFVLREKGAAMELGGLAFESMPLEQRSSQFDLSLMMIESDRKLAGTIEYNTDLFEHDTIARMAGHFTEILDHAARFPDTRVSDMPILTESEQKQLLETFSEGKPDELEWNSVIDMFENQVQSNPDRTAVVFGLTRLTFRRLDELADIIADALVVQYDVRPGRPVGSMLDRSEWAVVAMLGILKAGGVYTPIDPAYPEDRIRYMLDDASVKIVLSEPRFFDVLQSAPNSPNIFDITSIPADIRSMTTNRPVSPDQPSYLLYTSGSTGVPKGVLQTHRTLTNLMRWQKDEIGGDLNILQYAALGFDVSIQETLYSLTSGCTLHVIPNDLRYDMAGLADYITENRIDLITMPFTPLGMLFRENAEVLNKFAMKHIITSGEALQVTPELADYLKRRPDVKLHNQYGPTETHVVTAHTMSAAMDNIEEYPPIGRPVNNTGIFILDEHLSPAPVGVKGEIYVSGANLAEGYLHRDDLTMTKFVTTPLKNGARMYRTGDIGRWRPDGIIEFLGRNDDQVKIRGNRVEPGEIETRLLQTPEVREAVVVARPFRANRVELAAYIVPRNEWNPESIRRELQTVLPHYMIPSYFVQMKGFTLSPNGKVNKKDLPDPLESGIEIKGGIKPPGNDTEKRLVEIWRDVLKVDSIGVTDNFFELGGHSLKATQIMSRIHKEFNVKLALKDIFMYQTIEELFGAVQKAKQDRYAPIEPVQPVAPADENELAALRNLIDKNEEP